ncbi:MAG: SDR family oxidoreductase [Pseudomonadota bacterium]|nr:SDR family oxidoreductase [Pseudomonadota bacterium]
MGERLANKNVLITGAGAGIGFETACLFGREGARVSIIERDGTLAERAAAELRKGGVDAAAFCVDVTDARGVAEAFGKIISRYAGRVHVLINNAGIAEFGSVDDATLDSWERVIAVNVTGTFLCSQAVLPYMKQHGGAIVNLASIAGLVGFPKMAAYCTAKAAVIGLTRQMAADYTALGIRVNCLCPGRVTGTGLDRQILGRDTTSETQAKLAKYPIGRFGRPEEIAQAALFLATDESSFVSGATFCVDGGMTAI